MIVGLTGGIGSGKSLVSQILSSEYGFTVLQTDDIAKELMNGDAVLMRTLKNAFGNSIYLPNGKLDTKKYASIIYGNPANQKKSDSIVHPAVWEETEKRIRVYQTEGKNIAIETALPGNELAGMCDIVWHVHSDKESRIERLIRDRGYTVEYAESIIKKQPKESQYIQLADQVINNNGTIDDLREEIKKLL